MNAWWSNSLLVHVLDDRALLRVEGGLVECLGQGVGVGQPGPEVQRPGVVRLQDAARAVAHQGAQHRPLVDHCRWDRVAVEEAVGDVGGVEHEAVAGPRGRAPSRTAPRRAGGPRRGRARRTRARRPAPPASAGAVPRLPARRSGTTRGRRRRTARRRGGPWRSSRAGGPGRRRTTRRPRRPPLSSGWRRTRPTPSPGRPWPPRPARRAWRDGSSRPSPPPRRRATRTPRRARPATSRPAGTAGSARRGARARVRAGTPGTARGGRA